MSCVCGAHAHHLTITIALILMAVSRTSGTIRGVYTAWDAWSPCDVTCGRGSRVRYRACYPVGADCAGPASDVAACNMKPCPDVGRWSEWTQWTDCTKSCDIGLQTKYRACLSAPQQCVGSNRNVRVCNTKPCNTSGGWSAWNEWSSCSKPCGRGIQYRDRTCEDPAPSGGGMACQGPGTQVGFCFERPCSDKAATQVSVFDGEAYLEYEKTFVARKLLSIFIKFKPEELDGLLVYRHHGANDTTPARNDTVVLGLQAGKVEFFVQAAGLETWIRHDAVLELSKWHNVYAAVVGSRIVLRVDNGIPLERRFTDVEMEEVDLDQQMFVGGVSELFSTTGLAHPGFVGWIAILRVNYEDYFLDDTEEVASVNEEINHPIYQHLVEKWDVDAEELYPTYSGNDYTVFTCSDCHKPDLSIEVILKPFRTYSGLVWSTFGEEPGSYLVLYFRKNSLVLCMNLGLEKLCTITEPIAENKWLTVTVSMKSKQAQLRLNHEHAYIITLDGQPYRAKPPVHFAGGELDYWTLIYMITKQIKGFVGILYSITINKKDYNVLREVAMRETGRSVSALSASVAAKYDEFHEPPSSEVEFQCDLSVHEDKLGVTGGTAFWLREGEIIQNFSSISIQKVPGMKHATKLTLRNRESGDNDGFYGCLLRTGHYEILVHVFGISFDDANDIDFVEVSETAVLTAALLGSLCVLVALFILLKTGLLRRFPAYKAIMDRMPSWFTDGHRKNFLLRHTCSLQRTGQLPPDYIQRLLTMQEKAIQTPSVMDVGRLYEQPHDAGFPFDADSDDYEQPIPRRPSDGTVFPRPLIGGGSVKRGTSQGGAMKIPDHIRRAPERYLPGTLTVSESSDDTEPEMPSSADTPARSDGESSRKGKRRSSRYTSERDSSNATSTRTTVAAISSGASSSSNDSSDSHHKRRNVKFGRKTAPVETSSEDESPGYRKSPESRQSGGRAKFHRKPSMRTRRSDEFPSERKRTPTEWDDSHRAPPQRQPFVPSRPGTAHSHRSSQQMRGQPFSAGPLPLPAYGGWPPPPPPSARQMQPGTPVGYSTPRGYPELHPDFANGRNGVVDPHGYGGDYQARPVYAKEAHHPVQTAYMEHGQPQFVEALAPYWPAQQPEEEVWYPEDYGHDTGQYYQ